MAKAKKSAKKPARKRARTAAAKAAAKPVRSVLSKSALIRHLAGTTGAAAKDVRAVIAALEETIHADVLLHVVDGASPIRDRQVEEVNKVLAEIGAAAVPQILVMNKIDLSGVPAGVDRDDCGNIRRVRLSARTGAGLGELRQALIEVAASKDTSRISANKTENLSDAHVT